MRGDLVFLLGGANDEMGWDGYGRFFVSRIMYKLGVFFSMRWHGMGCEIYWC